MGECRGAKPHCRGCGGVLHKHTGRVGGKNYVRQEQLSDDMKCDRMRLNETVLKVSPLLATPNEATVATSRATLAQCVGVSVVPNEATVATFPASPLGVNGAKRAKLSHKIEISPSETPSFPDGNLASRPRVDDREWNEMEPNGTDLKVMPRLAVRDEANQGHNQGRVAHRVRVNGVPNEATVASFPASTVGVNEAKQGQMRPGFTPLLPFQRLARRNKAKSGQIGPLYGGSPLLDTPKNRARQRWHRRQK